MHSEVQYSDLVEMDKPEAVFDEAKTIVRMVHLTFDFSRLSSVFEDTVRLFRGRYPGYRACMTEYHDLRHTTDVFLATARLIHGIYLSDYIFSKETIELGLISSLMHDTGYILKSSDGNGTGAKYTAVHVDRSIEFMEKYLAGKRFTHGEVRKCRHIIRSTDLAADFAGIPFDDNELLMMGRVQFAADLLGQMADRIYLEKLLFLYREFREGNVMGYGSEKELLDKTFGFYDMINKRLEREFAGFGAYMRNHFRSRWNIDSDLYGKAAERNMQYLRFLMDNHGADYRDKLRRGNLTRRLFEMEETQNL